MKAVLLVVVLGAAIAIGLAPSIEVRLLGYAVLSLYVVAGIVRGALRPLLPAELSP